MINNSKIKVLTNFKKENKNIYEKAIKMYQEQTKDYTLYIDEKTYDTLNRIQEDLNALITTKPNKDYSKFWKIYRKIKELQTLTDIGEYIEQLDINVCENDMEQFQKVLDKYFKQINPDNELTILECVEKMPERIARKLLDELMKFSYED